MSLKVGSHEFSTPGATSPADSQWQVDERSSDVEEEDDGLMEEIRAKIKECQARVEMRERDSVDGHVNDCEINLACCDRCTNNPISQPESTRLITKPFFQLQGWPIAQHT